ncbi:MAG: hypothetical protein IPO32_09565 [Crocinitomicaceae bacterium]|nr:hypothetical protein [Crocinitomicaceae bacterium]
MKRLFLIFCIGISVTSFSQFVDEFNKNQNKREKDQEKSPFGKNRRDAIWSHSQSQHRGFGWFVNPGLTYMLGNSADDENRSYDLTATGLPGYYLEGGVEILFKKAQKVVHYFDAGLGIKHFSGQERYQIEGTQATRGQFNLGSVFLRADIHNVWQLNMFNFIDQSLGFNIDYRVYGGNPDDGYLSPLASVNQSNLVAQLHYTVGFGYKIRDGFFVVPSVQTPILTLFRFDDINPSHHWFNSRYQPLIFTLKFAWLFPKKGCTPVEGSEGISDDKI